MLLLASLVFCPGLGDSLQFRRIFSCSIYYIHVRFDHSHWINILTFAISIFAFLKQISPFQLYMFNSFIISLKSMFTFFAKRKLFYKTYSNRKVVSLFIETHSFSSILYKSLLFKCPLHGISFTSVLSTKSTLPFRLQFFSFVS